MKHTDVLGREIRIRDLVLRLSKFTTGVTPCIVTSLCKHMIKVNDGVKCDPNRVVVITDQILTNGVDNWTNILETRYLDYIRRGEDKLNKYERKHNEH